MSEPNDVPIAIADDQAAQLSTRRSADGEASVFEGKLSFRCLWRGNYFETGDEVVELEELFEKAVGGNAHSGSGPHKVRITIETID